MKNSFQKKIGLWVFGLAFGMICLSCASTSPKPGGLEPRLVPAPAPQEAMPAAPQTVSTPQEAPPSKFEPIPPPSKPGPKGVLEVKPKPKETSYVHTVKWSGETFSIIAGWYTGNIENWKALVKANPNINPNRIFEGNRILIPETLMKKRESMPKEFVDRFYSKTKKEKTQPKTPSRLTQTQEEELKLIGPKKSPKN